MGCILNLVEIANLIFLLQNYPGGSFGSMTSLEGVDMEYGTADSPKSVVVPGIYR